MLVSLRIAGGAPGSPSLRLAVSCRPCPPSHQIGRDRARRGDGRRPRRGRLHYSERSSRDVGERSHAAAAVPDDARITAAGRENSRWVMAGWFDHTARGWSSPRRPGGSHAAHWPASRPDSPKRRLRLTPDATRRRPSDLSGDGADSCCPSDEVRLVTAHLRPVQAADSNSHRPVARSRLLTARSRCVPNGRLFYSCQKALLLGAAVAVGKG